MMSSEAIAGIVPVDASADVFSAEAVSRQSAPLTESSFATMVSQGLKQVNQQLMTSQTDLQRLAVGDVQNLHQLMIRLEETKMSFQLMLQVRNRLLEAYQDVMRMQV